MKPSWDTMTEHVRAAADVARAEAFRRPPDHSDLSDTAVEWMAPELLEAWRVVARDLDTPKALVPAVRPRTGPDWPAVGGVVSVGAEPDEQDSMAWAAIWWPYGGGSGIGVECADSLAERVACLADQVQVEEVEALPSVGLAAVWPECPLHPNSHPLRAELRDGAAVWACAESVIAPIGSLGQDR